MAIEELRVLIVAEHASLKLGGEASLPFFYFKLLRKRGIEAWLLVHPRTRDELRALFPDDFQRISFVPDTMLQRLLSRAGKVLPQKVQEQTLGLLIHLLTQLQSRGEAKELVKRHQITVVHEPMPISPKQVSLMFGLGAPVVMGPLCGGMDYPPAFRHLESWVARGVERVGRKASHLLNRLVPGRLLAERLIVANPATRLALPRGTRGKILEVVESGVDLDLWKPMGKSRPSDGTVRFVFSGRLIRLKGVDLLLEAFQRAKRQADRAVLEILGDGPLRVGLEAMSRKLGLADSIVFQGWLSRPESAERLRAADVFVLPSLRECGGTVILEAMAMGLPVITTHWGGPAMYVDDSSGIRVEPGSRESFVAGLAEAMVLLAGSSEMRREMGRAAQERVRTNCFDWDSKVDRLIEIYREVTESEKRQ